MSPSLNAAPTAARPKPQAPRPAATPSVQVLQIARAWPWAAGMTLGGTAAATGMTVVLDLPGWTGLTIIGGLGATLAVAVAGERQHRRRQLTVHIDVALAPLTGLRGGVKVRRWDGHWVGLPKRLKVRYAPGVDQNDPAWLTEVTATLQRRLMARYRVVRHDPIRCQIVFALACVGEEALTPVVSPAQARAERTVRELLGVSAGVQAEWHGQELVGLEVEHEAGIRVATPAQRARIERVVSTMLPGRWRARWLLEEDRVRFELRPSLPTKVPQPVYEITEENRYELRLGVDEDGEAIIWKLRGSTQPHLLVVGPTGGGKTVTIMTAITQAARRGWAVYIIDPKRIEYLGLRDWPNVRLVATRIWQQAALIHHMYLKMEERYALIEEGVATEDDFEPMFLVLDEYRTLASELVRWYQRLKVRGMPAKCPLLEELAILAAKARSAGIHLVLGTQRPDAEFLTGDLRDNMRCRISLGRLSPQGAQMMWDAQYIGVAIPNIRGRGTAARLDGRPVETQTYWTPDPRRVKPEQVEDQRLLDRLRPAEATYEALVVVPPEVDPETETEPGFWDFVEAQFAAAATRPDLAVLRGRASGAEGAVPGQRPSTQPLADLEEEDLAVVDEPEEDLDPNEGYEEPVDVAVEQTSPGDRVLISEDDGELWGVIEDSQPDLLEEGLWCLDYRTDADDSGSLRVPADQLVTVRYPVELGELVGQS